MVPPGASFEFFEGPVFEARTQAMPELVEAIIAETRLRFDRFRSLELDLKVGELEFDDALYGFVVRRQTRSRISLLWVWNMRLEPLNDQQILTKIQKGRPA